MEYITTQEGVRISSLDPKMFASIKETGGSGDLAVMTLQGNQSIKEHVHGNSMYFSKNVANVTIAGKKYALPFNAWVFIPEGVSHGWSGTQEQGEGAVLSYHPDHNAYELLSN